MKEILAAQEIVSEKSALSVLSNVLLTARDGKIEIKATDVKMNMTTSVAVDVAEEGEITVLCSKLSDILKSLPDGDAEFEITEKDNMAIAVVRSHVRKIKYQFNCTQTDKFPELPGTDGLNFFNIPAKDLRRMISQTVFAVSNDITRYFMSGVYFEKKDRNLVLVATDGRRLAYAEKEILPDGADFNGSLVPPKILEIITRRSSDEGIISMAFTDKMIFFRVGSYEFSSALVDGKFPNYERVIPKEQKTKVEISTDEISASLKRISVMTDKTGRVSFVFRNGSLSVVSRSADYGNATDEIQCGYSGDDVVIAMNCKHISEPLSAIGTGKVSFEFTEPLRPVTMRPVEADGILDVIMPMAVE